MEYRLKKSTDRKKALALLSERFDLLLHKAGKVERVYYDTFDWRLFAQGFRVEEIREGNLTRTEWRENKDEALLGRLSGKVPAFAADWPGGVIAERLAQTIKMRALLPVARVRQTIHSAELRDKRGKIVARLSLEKSEAVKADKTKTAEPSQTARLTFPKGYGKSAGEIQNVFEKILGLSPSRPSYLDIIERAGQKSLPYSSKLGLTLKPPMRAEEALRAVFMRLSAIMEQNLNGTIAATDTEFLHDFRVSVRKTRSALGQMKYCVPPPLLAKFRPAFGKIGTVTGPTRDLDVYLLKFKSYTATLSPESQSSLEPLRCYLAERQKEEQQKLAKYLKSQEYLNFFSKWRVALGKRWKSGVKDWQGEVEITNVAGKRILKIYKRIMKQGAMLSPHSPPPAVHEMRIACKKLRYMIEFFRSLYPAAEVDPLAARLKELQDTLGDFQDHEVHRQELYGYAAELAKRKAVPPRTLVAMGELAESLAERQRKAREEIAGKFAAFGAPETKNRFRAVFGPRSERSDADEGGGDLQH